MARARRNPVRDVDDFGELSEIAPGDVALGLLYFTHNYYRGSKRALMLSVLSRICEFDLPEEPPQGLRMKPPTAASKVVYDAIKNGIWSPEEIFNYLANSLETP